MDNAPICFDDWEHALRTSVPSDRRRAYREAIVKFRYWLRETGKLPDAATFREHLEWKKSYLVPDRFKIRREALRWYYQEGRLRMKAAGQAKSPPLPTTRTACEPVIHPEQIQPLRPEPKADQGAPCSPQEAKISVKSAIRMIGSYRTYEMNDVPTAGARDLGGPSWEKALVSCIREKNLAWTSEKTYRSWYRRFIDSCGGKPITELGHGDVRHWLSDLAVKERVSVATQRQALNAVVFSSVKC